MFQDILRGGPLEACVESRDAPVLIFGDRLL